MSLSFKNEVQLRGIIRSVKALPRGSKSMYSMQVETQRAYVDRAGNANIRKENHPVVAWPGRHIPEEELRRLRAGNVVYIKGHLNYEPEFHIFAESVTLSRTAAAGVETPVKI